MSRPVVSAPLYALLNKVDPPAVAVLYCVPTRVIRVTATDQNYRAFRVEQLVITTKDPNNPHGNWATLSSHADRVEGASYPEAVEAAYAAQKRLVQKLQQRKLANQPKLVRL